MIGDALVIYDPERGFLARWKEHTVHPDYAVYTKDSAEAFRYRKYIGWAKRTARILNAQVISESKAETICKLRWKYDK